MPAGSLMPASPSRVVPERPPISRRPRTENITAGSVGASGRAEDAREDPVEAQR